MDVIDKVLTYKKLRQEISLEEEKIIGSMKDAEAKRADAEKLKKQVSAYLESPNVRKIIGTIENVYRAAYTFCGDGVKVNSVYVESADFTLENAVGVIVSAKNRFEISSADLIKAKANVNASLESFFRSLLTLKKFVKSGELKRSYKTNERLARLEAEAAKYPKERLTEELSASFRSFEASDGIIYVGGISNKISDGLREYIFSEFGVEYPAAEPFFLKAENGRSNLFIEREEYSDGQLMQLLSGMFFTSLNHCADVFIEFACIESSSMHPAALATLYNKISVCPFLMFSEGVSSEDERKVHSLLQAIKTEKDARNVAFADKYRSLGEYNAANPYVRKNYVLLVINGFSSCVRSKEDREMLERILSDGYVYGIFAVIIGENKDIKEKYDDVPALDLGAASFRRLKFDELSVSASAGDSEVLGKIKEERENASIFYLPEMLSRYAPQKKPFYDDISVPLGLSYGQIYALDIIPNNAPGGFILGMSRSGKSAFLQTFILSASSIYTDEEVVFYLIDFKSGVSNTFNQYDKTTHATDLYVPNVKYLSFANKPENATDVLTMIRNKQTERMRLFNTVGVDKLGTYNREIEKCGGKKLPLMIVIIDEFNSFLDSDSGSADSYNQISSEIRNILKGCASAGIVVFFSGQNPALRDDATSQIVYRICFDPGSDSYRKTFSALYGGDYAEELSETYRRDLMGRKGYAYFNSQGGAKPRLVRTSFAGDVNETMIKDVAAAIRAKYSSEYLDSAEQMIAGVACDVGFEPSHLAACKDKDCLAFPIGVSSSDRSPVFIEYAPNDSGKVLTGKKTEKLFAMENVVMSMMIKSGVKNITYAAFSTDDRYIRNDRLREATSENPAFFGGLTLLEEGDTDAKELVYRLGKRIIELRKSVEDRQINRRRAQNEPCALFIHGVSVLDLTDRFIEKLKEERSERAQKSPSGSSAHSEPAENTEFPSSEEIKAFMPDMSREEYERLFALAGSVADEQAIEPDEETADDVTRSYLLKSLKHIYKEGAKYGVYVFLSDVSADADFLCDVTDDSSDYRKKRIAPSAIYAGDNTDDDRVYYLSPYIKTLIYKFDDKLLGK